MAELTIRLVVDPDTRKKNVIIAYHGDEDALPMEHEDEHRRLVDRLIEGGALSAAELGKVVIQREQERAVATESSTADTAEQQGSVARET
jgi:hypothetical protein